MKRIFSRRKVLVFVGALFILHILCFVVAFRDYVRTSRRGLLIFALRNLLSWFSFGFPDNLPDDIVDEAGTPILSWRVAFSETLPQTGLYGDEDNPPGIPIDVSKPWNDPENLEAAKWKPPCYFHPDDFNGETVATTCLVRIRETHEKIKKGTLDEKDKKKAYLVLVDPEDSVLWTKPYDVSWKELASGKVKLLKDPYLFYVDAERRTWRLDKLPETHDEWVEFCGFVDSENDVR